MSCKVFVRPEAERDLASSYAFYQECRRSLGDDFLNSVEESFERISKNPFMYPDIHRGIRRALLRLFSTPRWAPIYPGLGKVTQNKYYVDEVNISVVSCASLSAKKESPHVHQ
ncbi:hypothetical protein NMQ14_12535 [Methyloversatilis sp. XJ19-13]|uniref:hypothetical protein n=1 Tax=Methyloversatilis sp. XJ19-13 TaxID=2963430 RepID=UPI00211C686C|nr:hypothetical protein [Methyloversatilis sp. XJ19-13]MCQ9375077.1 hypothetical protein [Methyloversatilis sp. XJ19-13]